VAQDIGRCSVAQDVARCGVPQDIAPAPTSLHTSTHSQVALATHVSSACRRRTTPDLSTVSPVHCVTWPGPLNEGVESTCLESGCLEKGSLVLNEGIASLVLNEGIARPCPPCQHDLHWNRSGLKVNLYVVCVVSTVIRVRC